MFSVLSTLLTSLRWCLYFSGNKTHLLFTLFTS